MRSEHDKLREKIASDVEEFLKRQEIQKLPRVIYAKSELKAGRVDHDSARFRDEWIRRTRATAMEKRSRRASGNMPGDRGPSEPDTFDIG